MRSENSKGNEMRIRTLAISGAMLGLFTLVPDHAFAEDRAAEIRELQEEIDLLKKKNELNAARYGAPLEGKSGEITGPEKVAGIAQRRALALSAAAAKDLGGALKDDLKNPCKGKSLLVTDDAAVATKLMHASSLEAKLVEIDARIKKAQIAVDGHTADRMEGKSLLVSAGALLGAANTVVDIWKLFQADYSVASFTTSNNQDWVTSHFMQGIGGCPNPAATPCAYSNRFPITKDTVALAKSANDLVTLASDLKKKVDDKFGKSKKPDDVALVAEAASIVEAMKKVQAALLDGGTTGIAPVASIAPYVRAVRQNSCIVRVIDTAPDGIVLTKDTIFGKGGKVYLHTTVQLAAIVTNGEGAPEHMACKQRSLATTVKLSRLAKMEPSPDDIPWGKGSSPASADCATL